MMHSDSGRRSRSRAAHLRTRVAVNAGSAWAEEAPDEVAASTTETTPSPVSDGGALCCVGVGERRPCLPRCRGLASPPLTRGGASEALLALLWAPGGASGGGEEAARESLWLSPCRSPLQLWE